MKNRILIISYDYSPMVTPNSFRWSNVSEYWAQQGDEIHVVCAWKPSLDREEVLNGVHIHRVGGVLTEKIRDRFINSYEPLKVKIINRKEPATIKQNFFLSLKWLHDRTWKNIYWPDFACLWFLSALRIAEKLIKKQNINHFISVSWPFTGHLVGKALKKKNPEVHWVVDIIDPFCFHKSINNQNFYGKLNKIIERKVFFNSQAISVLSKPIKDKYSVLFPESAHKIFINPNLFTNFKKDQKKSLLITNNKMKRLVFIGTLSKEVRSPKYLLRLFEMLMGTRIADKIELHFWGEVGYCGEQFLPYKHLIGNAIFLHGVVPRVEAIQAMYAADLLINIGNMNPYQEPSKIVEYAGTCKPIINIMAIKNDSSAGVLNKYPAVISIFGPSIEEQGIDTIVKFIETPPPIGTEFFEKFIRPYKLEAIAESYKSMLDRAIDE